MKFSKTTVMAALAGASMAFQADAATINVSADITASTTWTAANEYVLQNPVFVTSGATLTVEAGTVIRGVNATPPGALIVSRGSKIDIQGTAAAPVVMTDEFDDNIGASTGTFPYETKNNLLTAQWGGLIILGEAYLATNDGEPATPSPDASLTKQIEGIENFGALSQYGGGDDDDDSGSISYLSIRYGGFVLGADNEINGLTLGGVGRATDINHVEIFQGKDDGVEFFGSTVDTKYMLVWAVGDDSFDWDQGFRGKGQFWMAVQGIVGTDDKSDKGAEMDGADGDSSDPAAMPTIYNATFVGHGENVSQKNTALHFRDGTGGRYYNTIVEDFGGGVALIEGNPSNAKYEAADNVNVPYVQDAFFTHETADLAGNVADKLHIANSLFQGNNVNNAIGLIGINSNANSWGASSSDNGKDHYGFFPSNTGFNLLTAADNNLDMNAAAFGSSLNGLTRAAAVVHGGTSYNPVSVIDPRAKLAFGGDILTYGRVPPADGFFTPVNFIGAMAGKNWTAGWTLASRLGLIATPGAPAGTEYTGLVPSITASLVDGVDINVVADMYAGLSVQYWCLAEPASAPGTFYYLRASDLTFQPGFFATTTDLVGDFSLEVLSAAALGSVAADTYTFYFGIDLDTTPGLQYKSLYFDSATVVVP